MVSGRGAGSAVLGWLWIDDRYVDSVESSGQIGGGDHGRRCGVGNHEFDSCSWVFGIDGQVGRPRLEYRGDGGDGLCRALHQ